MIFHDFRKFPSASVCFHMFLDSPRRAWMLLDALDAPESCVAVCSPHFQVWSFIEKKVRIFRCRGLAEKSQIQIFRKKIDFFFSKKIDFFFWLKKFFGSIWAWESIQIIDFRCLTGLLRALLSTFGAYLYAPDCSWELCGSL